MFPLLNRKPLTLFLIGVPQLTQPPSRSQMLQIRSVSSLSVKPAAQAFTVSSLAARLEREYQERVTLP
jgi:hypothetical protein